MAEKSTSLASLGDEDDGAFDEVETALTGINMLLNNGFEEALCLFEKYKEESPLMHAGYSFVHFMEALMSFEEDKVAVAMKALQETEKRCEVSGGFVKSVRRKFSKKKKTAEVMNTEERLQRQVIVADSVLYQSILVFTRQDVASYIKGGWHLRKAWKIYHRLHTHITRLKDKVAAQKIAHLHHTSLPENLNRLNPNPSPSRNPNSTLKPNPNPDSDSDSQGAWGFAGSSENVALESMCQASSSSSQPPESAELNVKLSAMKDLSEESIARLLGAVDFGYGAFQLCMSMVPPKILKLIEFLGFEGDREAGLACLEYTSHSRDMKAPLATLALLWYHTVLRPFFALDGPTRYSEGEPARKSPGTQEAEVIIRDKEAVFPNSSLFLFFRGRIHRLRREADQSYEMFMKAYSEAKGQREIELMCLYEISWYNLMKMNWDKATEGFHRLRKESKWSRIYYSYVIAVCLGAWGQVQEANRIFRDLSSSGKRKVNQIEQFVTRRVEKLKGECGGKENCQLLALELIFLWHSFPSCHHTDLHRFLEVCDSQKDPSLYHLKYLIEGAIYNELGEESKAIQSLKESVAYQQEKKEDAHVAAFALFELALIYMRSPLNKAMAKEHLQQIKDHYKDYDFENRLSVRVNNALKQLKRGTI